MSTAIKSDHSWIQTYTGKQFWPLNPSVNDIDIEDIAHALSNQCRFAGHCEKFYSVAQHSVLVSHFCDADDALWGLLHDASEAYLVDMCRPVKRCDVMQGYRDAEKRLMRAICVRFGLPIEEPLSVGRADNALLRAEQRDLMKPAPVEWSDNREGAIEHRIYAWEPVLAKAHFLARFNELAALERAA